MDSLREAVTLPTYEAIQVMATEHTVRVRTCRRCGVVFVVERGQARYCSPKHAGQARMDRYRRRRAGAHR